MDGEPFDIETGGEHAYLVPRRVPPRQRQTLRRPRQRRGRVEAQHSHHEQGQVQEGVPDAGQEPQHPTTHEAQVAAATVRYLLSRQEAFDLPGELDLEDIIAAYADFTDVIRHEVAALTRSDRSPT